MHGTPPDVEKDAVPPLKPHEIEQLREVIMETLREPVFEIKPRRKI